LAFHGCGRFEGHLADDGRLLRNLEFAGVDQQGRYGHEIRLDLQKHSRAAAGAERSAK
jgi:hypothetical protein